jgi:hypothetical protein
MPSPHPGLAAVLRDLGASVQLGGAPELSGARLATGLGDLDRLIGGGFPQGCVSEVVGPGSCGRTSLAFALLARATAAGECVAVVDGADAFDPPSADAAGVDLARVLWVRPPGLAEALRSAEHVLAAGGFALVVLDLARAERLVVPLPAWQRLRRSAAAVDAALVVLARERLAGSQADLALELAGTPRFVRAPAWLEALETRARVARSRTGEAARAARIRFTPSAA